MHQWSNEDVTRAWIAWRAKLEGKSKDVMGDAMRRVMSLAVELVAARGGGSVELPDGFADLLREMESRGSKREAQAAVTVRGLLASHATRRAQVATLQAKVADLERGKALLLSKYDAAVNDVLDTTAQRDAAREDVLSLRSEVARLKGELRQARIVIQEFRDGTRETMHHVETSRDGWKCRRVPPCRHPGEARGARDRGGGHAVG